MFHSSAIIVQRLGSHENAVLLTKANPASPRSPKYEAYFQARAERQVNALGSEGTHQRGNDSRVANGIECVE